MVSAVCSVSILRSLGQGIKLKWKLEDFHFHMHRHTHPSNLYSGDAKPKDVQESLRRSEIRTTMNLYAHSTGEAKRTFARLLDKVIGGNKKLPSFQPVRAKTRTNNKV